MTLPAAPTTGPASTVPGPTTTVTTSTPLEPVPTPPVPPEPPNGQPDKGFPDGVKVADMTTEQQVAYWKHYARQHENRVSALGNLTPDDVKALQDKAQQWDDAQADAGTDMEKAVRSAYVQAEKAVLAKIQPQLVTAEFRAVATGRINPEQLGVILEPLDLSKFLAADGSVDTAKVSSYVDGIAPAMGSSTAQPPFPSLGQGQHTPPPVVPGAAGKAAAEKRFGKPASQTT